MQNFEAVKALLHHSETFYLISVSMDSTYAYVNAHYHRLFNKQHGELVGQHYSVTIHQEDLSVCAVVAEKCFAQPELTFPATIRKHDGRGGYIATQWDYKAMFDEYGQPAGIFCIGYDITSFMRTSAALHQMEFMRSHVIRKPIANLVGLVGLLQTSEVTPATATLLQMIEEAVDELDQQTKR